MGNSIINFISSYIQNVGKTKGPYELVLNRHNYHNGLLLSCIPIQTLVDIVKDLTEGERSWEFIVCSWDNRNLDFVKKIMWLRVPSSLGKATKKCPMCTFIDLSTNVTLCYEAYAKASATIETPNDFCCPVRYVAVCSIGHYLGYCECGHDHWCCWNR